MAEHDIELIQRTTNRIDAAYTAHEITPDIMLLMELRDEIERLTTALGCTAAEAERLFRFVNESQGKPVEIVRRVK